MLSSAIVRRLHEAKQRGDSEVVVWGTGTPMREFLYVDDMAAASVHKRGVSIKHKRLLWRITRSSLLLVWNGARSILVKLGILSTKLPVQVDQRGPTFRYIARTIRPFGGQIVFGPTDNISLKTDIQVFFNQSHRARDSASI